MVRLGTRRRSAAAAQIARGGVLDGAAVIIIKMHIVAEVEVADWS